MGGARAVAGDRAACGILTYGGVSLFVVAFAVLRSAPRCSMQRPAFPSAPDPGRDRAQLLHLHDDRAARHAGDPERHPQPFFGTDAFAAPDLGAIGGLIMFALGTWWLSAQARKADGRGRRLRWPSRGRTEGEDERPDAGFWLALLPILVVIGLNFVMASRCCPKIDTSYLAGRVRRPAGRPLADRDLGHHRRAVGRHPAAGGDALDALDQPRGTVNRGSYGSMLPILNTPRPRSATAP